MSNIIWNGKIDTVVSLYKSLGAHNLPPRKLFFYGFTIGQMGFGIIVSRRVK